MERQEFLRRLSGSERIDVARQLREQCYETWMSDPKRTARLASLAKEIETVDAGVEVVAIAEWLNGILALSRGELDLSIELLRRSADRFRSAGYELDCAEVCVSITVPLAILGRYDEAAASSEEARQVFIKQGRFESAGKAEHNLGNIRLRQERFDEAETILKKARKRFSDKADLDKLVQIDNCLAMAISYQHRFEQARRIYQRVSAKAKKAGLRVTDAEIESNLGGMALLQADFDTALRHFQSSYDIYSDLGMEHQAAVAEQEIADLYFELRLLPEAERLFRRGQDIFAKLGMTAELAHANLYLARCLIELGLWPQASEPLNIANRCYEVEHNPIGGAKVELAMAQLDLLNGHVEMASARASSSVEQFRGVSYWSKMIEALIVKGDTQLSSGSIVDAQATYRLALNESGKRRLPHLKLPCLAALGRLALVENSTHEAENYFKEAVELTDAIRAPIRGEEFRSAFMNDKLASYHGLLQLYFGRGLDDDLFRAFTVAEQMRARSLSELMSDNSLLMPDQDSLSDEISLELRTKREELTWLYRRQFHNRPEPSILQQIDALEFEYSELNRRLLNHQLLPRHDSFESPDIHKLQQLLGTSAALVEYVRVNDRYHAFVISGTSFSVHDLGSTKDVNELIMTLRSIVDRMQRAPSGGLASETVYAMRHTLEALYKKLIGPIRGSIRTPRIVVTPIEHLNYVPFNALFDGFRYLVESFEILTAPSASIFMQCAERHVDASGKTVLVGVSDDKTPYVDAEVRHLSLELPRSVLLLGEAANMADVVRHAKGSKLLHLACHGRFRSDNPMYSTLQLSDGYLIVRDIYRMDLKGCGLVVLSGCETGLSLIDPGNEVTGLIRGFLAAGARSLVLSGWRVADEATYLLFSGFYRNLRKGMSPSTALCGIQRDMIREGKPPFFWAPFSTSGGW